MAKVIIKVLKDYRIKDNLRYITTDNAIAKTRSIVSLATLLKDGYLYSVGCAI